MNWPMVSLGEVMTLDSEPHAVAFDDKYRNIGILNYGRGAFAKPDIRGEATSASTLFKVRADQFIYSRLFAFEGAYTVVPQEFDGAFVSNEFPTFTLRADRIDPRYLRWVFQRPETWRALASKSVGLGDRRQRIHPTHVLSFEVPLPPLEEQQVMVERLDCAAKAVSAHLKEAKNVEREIASAVSSAFAHISSDAPRYPVGEIAPLVRRPVVVDPEARYPELGVRSFGRGTFHKPAVHGVEVGSKKLFSVKEGDLVFNIIFAWEGALAIAKQEDAGRVGSHRFLTCVPDGATATSEFLRYYFLSNEGLHELSRASPGGAGRNRTLGIKAFESIVVPTPSLDAQGWFNGIQQKAREAQTAQAQVASHLNTLVPAMLHQALGQWLAGAP